MTEAAPKIRVFVAAPLAAGTLLALTKQAHYLANVMRQGPGDAISVFNGSDGAWRARLTHVAKRQIEVEVEMQIAPQVDPPDLWLLFAPIKKARTDFIVEKATELGVARIQPVITRFTNAERVRTDRLTAHAIEAAEQCGGTHVPEVAAPQPLERLIAKWPPERQLMFCDETRTAAPASETLARAQRGKWSILIGPEGGFSTEEASALRAMPQTTPVTLGPRILRADTAAVTAITAWQLALGDWQ